jgi:hypothetical protein
VDPRFCFKLCEDSKKPWWLLLGIRAELPNHPQKKTHTKEEEESKTMRISVCQLNIDLLSSKSKEPKVTQLVWQ